MMHEGQSPIALPGVKFLPEVVEPEFTAGWGEDSDGDGLPDIYEVLVTQTDPADADTGNTGTLDGYKDMAVDGWDALQKFRSRNNPLKSVEPPAPVELHQPTASDVIKAMSLQSDLPFQLQLEARTNRAMDFESIEHLPAVFYGVLNHIHPSADQNCDIRVSWRVPDGLPLSPEKELEVIEGKVNVSMFEAFTNELASGPALSPIEVSNRMATIEHAYRSGQMDKGLTMVEMMEIKDNQAQDFYGKVIDQNGDPVGEAKVKLMVNLVHGRGEVRTVQTDSAGEFQFTGIRGNSLSIVPEKSGYQIEGHGLGLKGLNGPDTTPGNRAVYTMWKLKGAEPMVHGEIATNVIPVGQFIFVDLEKQAIVGATNADEDLKMQVSRESGVSSLTMTANDGGFIEVTNDVYRYEAPKDGYQPMVRVQNTNKDYFLKSRGGQFYGYFHLEASPGFQDKYFIKINYFINPAGSRNLEYDPKQ